MYSIGISTKITGIEERLRLYQKDGVDVLELSPEQDAFDRIDFSKIARLAHHYGVRLWSFHLPFLPFERYDPSKRELAEETVRDFGELIKKASDIGIGVIVVHASGETIYEDQRAERMACAKDTLAKLADIAASCGAVIAVESLPRTCLGRSSSDILELIGAHDRLRVCFDTNHLLSEMPQDFVRAVGNKIITTHVSDYDNRNERHWLPGEGIIDWQALLSALREVGYQGPWIYELGFGGSDELIERERALTCEDFVRNAHEIFEGKPLTVIGKPITSALISWRVRYEEKCKLREEQKKSGL